MFHALQILTILLIAIALGPALAHAFEFPGKMRLDRDTYIAVQAIYYPGFTIAGISEPAGVLAAFVLLFFTPRSMALTLTILAICGLIAMQVVYWTITHPANKFWLRNAKLGGAGSGFFALDPARRTVHETDGDAPDWRKVRNRWEYSHIARAGLVFLSFLSLVLAIVVCPPIP